MSAETNTFPEGVIVPPNATAIKNSWLDVARVIAQFPMGSKEIVSWDDRVARNAPAVPCLFDVLLRRVQYDFRIERASRDGDGRPLSFDAAAAPRRPPRIQSE